jgi:hypothetical protein
MHNTVLLTNFKRYSCRASQVTSVAVSDRSEFYSTSGLTSLWGHHTYTVPPPTY